MIFLGKRSVLFYIILFTISFLTSCHRKKEINRISFNFEECPLFIDMPKNLTVFENISPVLYGLLWDHFQLVGFEVKKTRRDNYLLQTRIKELNQEAKFVSLDILPYDYKTKIVLKCELFDPANNLVAEKDFSFSKWVSRASNPVQGPEYLNFQYKQLLERSIPRIDQYFRKFLLKCM